MLEVELEPDGSGSIPSVMVAEPGIEVGVPVDANAEAEGETGGRPMIDDNNVGTTEEIDTDTADGDATTEDEEEVD